MQINVSSHTGVSVWEKRTVDGSGVPGLPPDSSHHQNHAGGKDILVVPIRQWLWVLTECLWF